MHVFWFLLWNEEKPSPVLFSNKLIKSFKTVVCRFLFHFSARNSCFSSLSSSPLTASLGPLSSQFCWTALALSPSPSSAPAELCPPHLPSGRHRNRPWTPRPQRSRSRSWTMNCCSLNQTPHLKRKGDFFWHKLQSFSWHTTEWGCPHWYWRR